MRKFLFIILFSLSLVAHSQSEFQTQSSWLKAHGSKLKSQSLTILSQPLHYDWKDWTAFAGVAAATTFAFVYDDEIYDCVNRNLDDYRTKNITKYTDVFGEELFIMPSIAAAYTIGAINENPRLKNLSLAALQSFIYTEAASAGLKVLTCRVRPSDFNSQHPMANSQEWLGPFATFESTSFPSGHAMRSFALATTVAGFYPEKKWVGIVSYSLATMTSVGRVIGNEHWTSDVMVGAALGYFIGRGVVRFNEKIGNINSVKIEPVATNYGVGVLVRF